MSQLLEDELRASLTEHARDLGSVPRFAEGARREAGRIRLLRRVRVGVGVAALVAVAALVPVVAPAAFHPAPPAVTPTPAPTGQEAVLDALAHDTGSLVAAGQTIADGLTGRQISLRGPHGLPLTQDVTLQRVGRAGDGYVVVLESPNLARDPGRGSVCYVGADGVLHPVGRASASAFTTTAAAATMDGLRIAYVADNADTGHQELVLTERTGLEILRHPVDDDRAVMVIALTSRGVWYSYGGPGKGAPFFWDVFTDRVSRLSADEGSWTVLGLEEDVLVADDGTGISAFDVSDPEAPRQIWRQAGRALGGALDSTGSLILTLHHDGGPSLVVYDMTTGRLVASADGAFETAWLRAAGQGRWGLVSYVGDPSQVQPASVRLGDDGRLTVDLGPVLPWREGVLAKG